MQSGGRRRLACSFRRLHVLWRENLRRMQKGIPKMGCPGQSEQSLFQRTAGRAGPPFEVLDLVSADAGVALLRGGDEVHGNIALVEAINVFKPGGGEKLVDGDDVLRRDLVPRRSRNVIGSEFLSVGL